LSVVFVATRALGHVHYSVILFWSAVTALLVTGLIQTGLLFSNRNIETFKKGPKNSPFVLNSLSAYLTIFSAGLFYTLSQTILTLTLQQSNPSLTIVIG
jgi:hypothetical protein